MHISLGLLYFLQIQKIVFKDIFPIVNVPAVNIIHVTMHPPLTGLGPAPLPPLEVAVQGHRSFYGPLPSFCWLIEVCVSLNSLNYLTEHDIDETFMCVKTALCWG